MHDPNLSGTYLEEAAQWVADDLSRLERASDVLIEAVCGGFFSTGELRRQAAAFYQRAPKDRVALRGAGLCDIVATLFEGLATGVPDHAVGKALMERLQLVENALPMGTLPPIQVPMQQVWTPLQVAEAIRSAPARSVEAMSSRLAKLPEWESALLTKLLGQEEVKVTLDRRDSLVVLRLIAKGLAAYKRQGEVATVILSPGPVWVEGTTGCPAEAVRDLRSLVRLTPEVRACVEDTALMDDLPVLTTIADAPPGQQLGLAMGLLTKKASA